MGEDSRSVMVHGGAHSPGDSQTIPTTQTWLVYNMYQSLPLVVDVATCMCMYIFSTVPHAKGVLICEYIWKYLGRQVTHCCLTEVFQRTCRMKVKVKTNNGARL